MSLFTSTQVRKAAGIGARSKVEILAAEQDMYVSRTTGEEIPQKQSVECVEGTAGVAYRSQILVLGGRSKLTTPSDGHGSHCENKSKHNTPAAGAEHSVDLVVAALCFVLLCV